MDIKITAEELYFLGTLLQAKYIDYAYIAALDDMQGKNQLVRNECYAGLGKKGLLSEDFSGDIEIDEEAEKLLAPVFFGEKETSLDICTMGDEIRADVYKFHFHDGSVTLVRREESLLRLSSADIEDIREIVGGILPDDYQLPDAKELTRVDKDKITRLISVKSGQINGHNEVYICVEINGVLYREERDNVLTAVGKETFTATAERILKGEQ